MKAVNTRPAKQAQAPVRRRQPVETRRSILEAATAEFAGKGLAGARVDEIAERAGVSKRMLYHYFGNKEALWLEVLESTYIRIRSEERRLELGHLPPEQDMRRLIEFTIGYSHAHPEFVTLLIGENLHRAAYLRRSQKIREMHTSLLAEISHLLERGVRDGVFRAGVDPRELYITTAALGFFYYSNIHTLSVIFGQDLDAPQARAQHLEHAVSVV